MIDKSQVLSRMGRSQRRNSEKLEVGRFQIREPLIKPPG